MELVLGGTSSADIDPLLIAPKVNYVSEGYGASEIPAFGWAVLALILVFFVVLAWRAVRASQGVRFRSIGDAVMGAAERARAERARAERR